MKQDIVKVFKALADRSRLKILNALLKESLYVELLSERLKLSPSTVSFHLKKLLEAGLVVSKKDQYYTMYAAVHSSLGKKVSDLIQEFDGDEQKQGEREKAYRQKVLDTFFEFGKVKNIPVQRKKRRIILEQIAQGFEIEQEYPEKEVNLIISQYHDDFCFIRREMIAEGMFTRDKGIYVRIK